MFNQEWELLFSEEYDDFELPWWWIDHGETAQEWFIREIWEEMSCPVIVSSHPLCTWIRKIHNGIRYFFVWYACKIDITQFSPSDEVNAYHFFSKKYLLQNIEKFPKQHYVIEHYDELLALYQNVTF